jgi:hypothetical protein
VGGAQLWHLQLRQHRTCHVDRVPVRLHGGMDADSIFGEISDCLVHSRPINAKAIDCGGLISFRKQISG